MPTSQKKRAKNLEQPPPTKRAALNSELDGADATTHSPPSPPEPSMYCKRIVVPGGYGAFSRKPGKARRSISEKCSLLQELLLPLPVDEFLRTCFRRQAVHVQWNQRKQDDEKKSSPLLAHRFLNHPILQSFLENASVDSLIRETSSESIFVWLPKPRITVHSDSANGPVTSNGTSTTPPPCIHSIEIPDAETALQLHELSGHALYFRASPLIEQTLVGALLRETGLGAGQYDPPGAVPRLTTLGRGEVEVFIGGRPSPATAAAGETPKNLITGWHYDFQENFTIQLSGVKQWTLHPGIVAHPLRGCTPHYDTSAATAMSTMESQALASRLARPTLLSPTSMLHADHSNGSSVQEEVVEMHPGDVLYFPAGMWHTVETVEPGISINISLMASNYASVTCQALQHLLLQHDEWRQCIQHCDSSGFSTSAMDMLQRLLETLPSLIEKEMATKGFSAQAILPPVLLTPTANKEDIEDEDTELEMENDADDGMDAIIEVDEFVAPEGGCSVNDESHWWNVTHVFIQNPLAILLHEEMEIRHCYERFAPYRSDQDVYFPRVPNVGANGKTDPVRSVYVLNINFAGNESHESAVRVRLRMDPRIVATIETNLLLPSTARLASMTEFSSDVSVRQHIDCLVFYGFLIWRDVT